MNSNNTVLSSSRAYQNIQDEITRCTQILEKHKSVSYCALILSWIAILVGRWSQYYFFSHDIFVILVFIIAFLVTTKFIEEDNALDVCITENIFKGIILEKKQGLKQCYYKELAKSYAGWNMCLFAFIRVSPTLMILFSLLNCSLLDLLNENLSKNFNSTLFPYLVHIFSGVILVLIGLFLIRIACKPYLWLLWKLETIK